MWKFHQDMIACHIQEYFVLENIQVYWSSSRKWTQVSDLSMINVRDFFLYILCILSPDIVNICATLFAVLWNRFLHFSSSPCIVVTMWKKKHGGQISVLPSKPHCMSPPLSLPYPNFSLKILLFPTFFIPVWVTFQMTNENHLLCKQFLFHPNSATYQCLCIW